MKYQKLDKETEKLIKKAEKHIREKHISYDSIIKVANKLINSPSLYEPKVYQKSINMLEKLRANMLEGTERYANILRKEAALYHGVGNIENEIYYYNLAIEANTAANKEDKNIEIYKILGMAKWSVGMLAEAEKDFNQGYELSKRFSKPNNKKMFKKLIKEIERSKGTKSRKTRAWRKGRER
jgi:tetratricopeptide (TPR) repeat protein